MKCYTYAKAISIYTICVFIFLKYLLSCAGSVFVSSSSLQLYNIFVSASIDFSAAQKTDILRAHQFVSQKENVPSVLITISAARKKVPLFQIPKLNTAFAVIEWSHFIETIRSGGMSLSMLSKVWISHSVVGISWLFTEKNHITYALQNLLHTRQNLSTGHHASIKWYHTWLTKSKEAVEHIKSKKKVATPAFFSTKS